MQSVVLDPIPGSGAVLVGYLHDGADEFISRDVRPCVIVCPGGGFGVLATHEAEPVAMAFYAAGYQAFVLSYSLVDPTREPPAPLGFTPLREASLAVMLIRELCAQWRVDPDRIAICGFSAGGHLACSLGTMWNSAELTAILDIQEGLNRPDAMILCYPVVTAGENRHTDTVTRLAGEGDREVFSLEKRVSPDTPPAFLWHTADDASVPVENSLLLASAMARAGVNCETHIFAHGPHGLGLATSEGGRVNEGCAAWLSLCLRWLGKLFNFPQ